MGTINPAIPTIGQPNSTEDADIRDGMVTIRDEINGNLDNDNIKAAANIAGSKLATNSVAPSKLSNATAGQLLIANASGVITATTVSGDVTIDNAGTTTISANAVGTTEIADDSITHEKMANNSVGNDEMRDAAVNTTEIVDSAVTTAKVTNDAITADKLKDSASTDADRAVTTNHIRNNAITKDKISLYTAGNKLEPGGDVTLTNSYIDVFNITSIPAGNYLLNWNLCVRCGSSTTLDYFTFRILNDATANLTENHDPIVGTAADYERYSFSFSRMISKTVSGSITLQALAVNTAGNTPANVSIINSNYAILGFKTD